MLHDPRQQNSGSQCVYCTLGSRAVLRDAVARPAAGSHRSQVAACQDEQLQTDVKGHRSREGGAAVKEEDVWFYWYQQFQSHFSHFFSTKLEAFQRRSTF